MDALRHGITGIRLLGDRDFIDVAWKRAFDAGVFVGPRLFVCGSYICATGGFGHHWPGAVQVDSPYEMRKAVREQLRQGADQIKLMLTPDVETTEDESMFDSELLLDEIQATTVVAHQKGKRVAAHAGGSAIKTAIRGGVDCIEHGYYLDDEAVAMMVEHDVFYVPTLVMHQDQALLQENGFLETDPRDRKRSMEARFLIAVSGGVTPEYSRVHLEGFQKALKAGVKIACGGDPNPIGEYTLLEIEHLVRAGMTEMEALIAATRTCADLCGVVDKLGTVEEGKLADLIVLSADPLDNIRNIHKLKHVFKGGSLVETDDPEGLRDFWELLFFD